MLNQCIWLVNKFRCLELKVDTKNKRQVGLYWIFLSSDLLKVPLSSGVNILSIHYHLYHGLFDHFLLCLRVWVCYRQIPSSFLPHLSRLQIPSSNVSCHCTLSEELSAGWGTEDGMVASSHPDLCIQLSATLCIPGSLSGTPKAIWPNWIHGLLTLSQTCSFYPDWWPKQLSSQKPKLILPTTHLFTPHIQSITRPVKFIF